MEEYYKIEENEYPLIPMRGIWAIPDNVVHFDCGRAFSKRAVENALIKDSDILLVNQIDVLEEIPSRESLYEFGTVASIKQSFDLQNGTLRLLVEAKNPARLKEIKIDGDSFTGLVEEYIYQAEKYQPSQKAQSLRKMVLDDFYKLSGLTGNISADVVVALEDVKDYNSLVNLMVSYLELESRQYYSILSELDVEKKLLKLHQILKNTIELTNLSMEIDSKVQNNLNKSQKEYYLREKMEEIRHELEAGTGDLSTADSYRKKAEKIKLSPEDKKSLMKDIDRFEKLNDMSPEFSVLDNYLDFAVNLPWNKKTTDNKDIKKAQKTLDADHYGLEKVKERIIETIAVRNKKKGAQGSIICLVGPPGVGKTSVARSIARALNRKFISIRLGGVTDEAEIRGHRRTYVGAMAGRIISAIDRVGVKNPVFLLDEIDKIGTDYRGDPASALLEVLDPEQNNKFVDRYLELAFDLSDCFFITTANDANKIPDALYDRLEVIEISGYIFEEKMEIAKRYLIDKQMKAAGLKPNELSISDAVIDTIIKYYTREAGVRELERQIGKICRRAVKEILTGKKAVKVTKANYKKYLGKEIFVDEVLTRTDRVGVANGLARTEVGGTMLTVEACCMEGKGNIDFTGSLGDVLKESGETAFSYIRANREKFNLPKNFYEKVDIHVHLPEGATPKDGPSAGITMTTAIASALTGRKVKSNLAMTGEVTLTGRVLPIGGLKEKALAAYSCGIKNVIIPKENDRDLEDIPEKIRHDINFIEASDVMQVIDRALI